MNRNNCITQNKKHVNKAIFFLILIFLFLAASRQLSPDSQSETGGHGRGRSRSERRCLRQLPQDTEPGPNGFRW